MAPLCWPAEIWLQVKGLFWIRNNNGNTKEIIQSKVKTKEQLGYNNYNLQSIYLK